MDTRISGKTRLLGVFGTPIKHSGSPIMYNLFHQDRWDYIYRLDQRNKPIQQKRVTIWFSNGSVVKVEHTDFADK